MGGHHVDLRFYGSLRDFLSSGASSGFVTRTFDVAGSVKDLIEGCGVPHTEVALVLANGRSVDYGYRVVDGDRIAVYPPFRTFDVSALALVAPAMVGEPRFVLDVHLGRLARYLRLVGFDCLYDREWSDPDLVAISTSQLRILLTRDVDLLMHGSLSYGYFVRAVDADEQLAEVAERFDLTARMRPFSRCMACNGALVAVRKGDVAERLPRGTRAHYDEFRRCPSCERLYWKGAHYRRLASLVAGLSGAPAPDRSASQGKLP